MGPENTSTLSCGKVCTPSIALLQGDNPKDRQTSFSSPFLLPIPGMPFAFPKTMSAKRSSGVSFKTVLLASLISACSSPSTSDQLGPGGSPGFPTTDGGSNSPDGSLEDGTSSGDLGAKECTFGQELGAFAIPPDPDPWPHSYPVGVAANATGLYWTDRAKFAWRAKLDGTQAEKVSHHANFGRSRLRVLTDFAYAYDGSSVLGFRRDGTASEWMGTFVKGLATDSSGLYTVQTNGVVSHAVGLVVPKPLTTIKPGYISALALDKTHVYIFNHGGETVVIRINKVSKTVETVVASAPNFTKVISGHRRFLATDENLYWINQNNTGTSALLRSPKLPQSQAEIVLANLPFLDAIVHAAGYVYITTADPNSNLGKFDPQTGKVQWVQVVNGHRIDAIAAYEGQLYLTFQGATQLGIRRLCW